MPKYIIPTDEIYRITTPSPYVIAKEFGLSYVRGVVYGLGIGSQSKLERKNEYYLAEDIFIESAFKNGSSAFFGTPVYNGLRFETGVYRDNEGKEVRYPAVELDTVLFDVAMTRNIVKTVVQGRNGTIKEYISDGDFDVNIKGVICSSDPRLYPEEEVSKLLQILKATSSVAVGSEFLNQMFGIYNLVIESYSFEMVAGFQNIQRFTMKCISDEPLEFKLSRR